MSAELEIDQVVGDPPNVRRVRCRVGDGYRDFGSLVLRDSVVEFYPEQVFADVRWEGDEWDAIREEWKEWQAEVDAEKNKP